MEENKQLRERIWSLRGLKNERGENKKKLKKNLKPGG